jgi:hypothetical protein
MTSTSPASAERPFPLWCRFAGSGTVRSAVATSVGSVAVAANSLRLRARQAAPLTSALAPVAAAESPDDTPSRKEPDDLGVTGVR